MKFILAMFLFLFVVIGAKAENEKLVSVCVSKDGVYRITEQYMKMNFTEATVVLPAVRQTLKDVEAGSKMFFNSRLLGYLVQVIDRSPSEVFESKNCGRATESEVFTITAQMTPAFYLTGSWGKTFGVQLECQRTLSRAECGSRSR